MGFSKLATSLAALALLGQTNALDPIIKKGTKFFYENGTQFFIKGVAYQQHTGAAGTTSGTTYVDPLADEASCTRDVPLLKALGTNTIRTYAIDPTLDHSACMKLLDAAGIYVISDLSEPSVSIEQDNPQWNTKLYSRYTDVIDELSQYDNVIGFFAGNEVTNNASNTAASAFVKAAVRDTKAYISDKGYRWMGVGYAANDDADIRSNIAHYFNCGEEAQSIDYWGYNIYEWCGQNTFEGSGYSTQVDFFQNYSVPVFFAEYGCNTQGGAAKRIFEETTALYSDDMTGVISGGIVYMYFQEANDYGLVSVSGTRASTLADYNSLSSRVAAATPSSTGMDAYTPSNTAAACPDVSSDWQASSNLPPTPDANLCSCMYSSLTCVPQSGLNTTAYGDIFGFICGETGNYCAGINANATTGVYGAYSMCNDTQKLGYVLDTYYKGQNSQSYACDSNGQATTTSAAVASGCSASLASASSANSVAATGTGGSSSATSSNIAAPIPMKNLMTVGDLAVGLYAVVAMGAGAAMVLL